MVTFTINIPPMLAYIPYMDPMGMVILDAFRVVLPNLANELGHQFFQSSQIIPARCGTHLHKALPTRLLNSWLLLTVAADLLTYPNCRNDCNGTFKCDPCKRRPHKTLTRPENVDET
jgi:hypothetical protein